MFDCPECAAKVKDDFAMLDDLKAVLSEPTVMRTPQRVKPASGWREWFRPMMLAPTFAALALACLAGYQNFVSIPAMLKPQLLETAPFVPTTRGATLQTVTIKKDTAQFAASFEVAVPTSADEYVC